MIEASTIPELLRARTTESPDRELLRYEGNRASYAHSEERSNRVARALAELGVGHGDRVAVMLPNGLEWPTVAFGVWKLGAIVVPVNVSYGTSDLTHVLGDSGAIVAVTDDATAAVIESVRDRCPTLRTAVNAERLLTRHNANVAEPGLRGPAPEDPATIQYTSGTTGFPKGCILSHRYWLDLGRNACHHVRLAPEDVALTAQPFYYMDPTWSLVACMLVGAPIVVLPRFSPSTFWRSVKENGVTYFYCLGTMPVYLFNQPESPQWERGHRVRIVVCSGIPPHLHADFERRWSCPWREAYGTTEVGAALMVPVEDGASVGTGAMGREVDGYEARAAGAGAGGDRVPDGKIGELQIRGGSLMTGYWNRPEATRAWNPDGWVRTGDLVFRDPTGYYHIVGRLKDMIRRGGENIAAAEVEAVLCDHPAVVAAACVPVSDDERGEEVKAFVQLLPGTSPESVPPEELLAFAKERLAPFKVPRYVHYVIEFPLTPSERIAKHQLLETDTDPRLGAFDAREGVWR